MEPQPYSQRYRMQPNPNTLPNHQSYQMNQYSNGPPMGHGPFTGHGQQQSVYYPPPNQPVQPMQHNQLMQYNGSNHCNASFPMAHTQYTTTMNNNNFSSNGQYPCTPMHPPSYTAMGSNVHFNGREPYNQYNEPHRFNAQYGQQINRQPAQPINQFNPPQCNSVNSYVEARVFLVFLCWSR